MSRGEDFLGCSQDVFHRNQADETLLCSQENWQESVIFIAQELQLSGFANICSSDGNFDVIALINCTWSLLRNYRSTLKKISELESQARRMTSDIDNLHLTSSRQRDLLEVKDRQSVESDERERRANLLLHSAQQLLKGEKEETRRLSGLLLHRESQYQHESKRREMEISRLKERIMKLLVEKSGSNVGGSKMGTLSQTVCATPAIEMTTLFAKPEGMGRTKWNTESVDQSREEDLYYRLTKDLKDRLSVISSENVRLVEVFYKFQNEVTKLLKDRGSDIAMEEDELSTVHLPLNISVKKVEGSSNKICQDLLQIFENYEKKIFKLESDLKIVPASEKEYRLNIQLNHARDDIQTLEAKLSAADDELDSMKRICLTQDYILKAAKPTADHSGAPPWTLGRPNVTPSPSHRRGAIESSPGITVIPIYNYGRLPGTTSRMESGRRSLSGSRDGSGTEVAVVKRRSPLPVRTSPTSSLSRVDTAVRHSMRPRSANLSGIQSPTKPSRSGSLSPSSTSRYSEATSRSLPRTGMSRRLTLTRPNTQTVGAGLRTSDSEDSATSKPPPSTSNHLNRYSRVVPTGRRTPSPGWRSDPSQGLTLSSTSSSSSDELSVQLQLLGRFIEQRQMAGLDEVDDSEMNAHLQNVRRALNHQKK